MYYIREESKVRREYKRKKEKVEYKKLGEERR